ncbi:adaptin N terminal region-domain-containing protein [Zopfochytrium polystomum]|nr:adaptin N terminal region-domain-containing protein [Zopfochytrium polystomum]
MASPTATNPRFFSTTKKGENFELRADLNSEYREKRKETVKKVIANMTIGKDVSSLFADVVKNMQTEDLELKKLVYLYLINYAKSQPELVILAVNTFVKDTDDINPLIRALAIRTMGCLRVEKIVDYLLEPLKKGLKDDDPYVRKTAALCVAKLFDLNPAIAIDNGLVAILQDMISDRNPMVIANAVAALSEINETSIRKDIFSVNNSILLKLLAALNECTEWGQICILTSLATYRPADSREAAEITERVIARLQHANASVVLTAVRIGISSSQEKRHRVDSISVTLLSSEPEIQYVALRNINLILQKRPDVLSQEMRVFFTKYNDPPYVKLEKLEVIIKLCSESTIDQVLSELREYATEVDVDFVRRSVRAIGRCAIKIESASERCVNVLLELIKTRVNHVVQESIVVIKDVFRKYPNKYEGIIPALCENLETLDEPDAKSALIWIIGEYAERIENAEELLEFFVENFKDENSKVQLQLLTACVKLFLKKPGSAQELVQKILQTATQGCENPDIRDRAYIYWRLLSSNPQAAKAVVLSQKPPIEADNNAVSETLLDELISNIGNLASVYHKPAGLLNTAGALDIVVSREQQEVEDVDDGEHVTAQEVIAAVGGNIENLLDLDFGGGHTTQHPATSSSGIDDLLGLMDIGSTPSTSISYTSPPLTSSGHNGLNGLSGTSASSPLGDLFGSPASAGGIFAGAAGPYTLPKESLLQAGSANGLDLSGTFSRRNGQVALELTFSNKGTTVLTDYAIQFNTNSYGLTPAQPLRVPPLNPSQTADVTLPLATTGGVQKMEPLNLLQVAIKNNVGVYYFQTAVPCHVLFTEDGSSAAPDASSFSTQWSDFMASTREFFIEDVSGAATSELVARLRRNNVFPFVSGLNNGTTQAVAKVTGGSVVLVELTVSAGGRVKATVKSRDAGVLPIFEQALTQILKA